MVMSPLEYVVFIEFSHNFFRYELQGPYLKRNNPAPQRGKNDFLILAYVQNTSMNYRRNYKTKVEGKLNVWMEIKKKNVYY
jgi:hypothetical protein